VADSGSVRVYREPSKWQDRARAYQVLIDGEPVGEIHNGATGEFAVGVGLHSLRLKVDWVGSPTEEFTVLPGQVVQFRCRAGVKPLFAAWELVRSIWRRDGWIQLEQVPPG
jgi:hypothetical protein